MKTIPAGLAAHLATRETTIAHALKVTRSDAQVFGFTSADQDASISGVTYSANPGLDVSQIAISSGLAVGNLELTTLHDGTVFTTADILGGVWRNAAFVIFRYNWSSIADGVENILAGTIGEIELRENSVVAELRDLRQYLQQPVGDFTSKLCRYRLGSSDANAGGLCLKSLAGVPWTVSSTLTHVTDNQTFRDSGLTGSPYYPADWFGEGSIEWTSGNNSGLTAKVKEFAANGTFTLALPMLQTVQVGDGFTATVGCRKRLEEDCRDKFSNVLNFGGEPHAPGLDAMTSAPVANEQVNPLHSGFK